MSINYPLIMPTDVKNLASITIRRQEPQNISISPWTGVQQVQVTRAQWWEADFSLPPLTRAQADVWEAFALQLNGSVGTFLLGDPEHETPRGIGGGSPLVDGAGQYENTVEIKNAPANLTTWLMAGDYIQLGTGGTARLYRVLQDVATTSAGTASILVWPSLRRPTIADEPVTINGAQGQFRLTAGALDFSRIPVFSNLSFRALEALDGNG